MLQQKVPIVDNRPVGPDCFRMTLASPEMAATAEPGQFVMLRLVDEPALLLPRPFSIFSVSKDRAGLELLYKMVGAGTRKMTGLKAGDTVSLVGPLGRGFTCNPTHHRVFLVAGGLGIAPLGFLARHLTDAASPHKPDCTLFFGGACQRDLICRDIFTDLNIPVRVTTEDGSEGTAGLVTDLLIPALEQAPPQAIFACGPPAMTKAVISLAQTHRIPCQVSIETMMSCGIGACLGCAVRSASLPGTYLHACKDGPVFSAETIDLP